MSDLTDPGAGPRRGGDRVQPWLTVPPLAFTAPWEFGVATVGPAISYLARYSRPTDTLCAYQLRRWFTWCEKRALDPRRH